MTARRKLLWAGGGSLLLLALCAASVVAVLRSEWFKNEIRLRIIATLQHVTGARVDLPSFDYRWRTLSVTLDDLTLHGTEAAGSPPLFHVKRTEIQLKIISLLRRKIDLQSITLDNPRLYLLMRPDGTTNMPGPPRGGRATAIDDQLLSLAVKRFQVRSGTAEINQRKYNFDADAERLRADLSYDASTAQYRGMIGSRQLKIDSAYRLPAFNNVSTNFEFADGYAGFKSFEIATRDSLIRGSATVHDFASPVWKAQLNAKVSVSQLASIFGLDQFRSGQATLTGEGTYHARQFAFKGTVDANNLSYRDRHIVLAGLAFQSNVLAGNGGLSLTRLRVRGLGATVGGNADLQNYRDLRLRGELRGLNIRDAAKLFTNRAIEWDGIAAGPVSVTGSFGEHLRNFVVSADLGITPGSRGIPVGGALKAVYDQRSNTIDLRSSRFTLPNSSVEVAGVLGRRLDVDLATTNLADAQPALALFDQDHQIALPAHLEGGHLYFQGSVEGPFSSPVIAGQLKSDRLRCQSVLLDSLTANIHAAPDQIALQNSHFTQGSLQASLAGQIGLTDWRLQPGSPLQLSVDIKDADISTLRSEWNLSRIPITKGRANVMMRVSGTMAQPEAAARIGASNLEIGGQTIEALQADLKATSDSLAINKGSLRIAHSLINIQSSYRTDHSRWTDGRLDVQAETPGLQLQDLEAIKAQESGLRGQLKSRLHISGRLHNGTFAPDSIAGLLRVTNISLDHTVYGNLSADANTKAGKLVASVNGKLRDSAFSGIAKVDLSGSYNSEAEIHLPPVRLASLAALIPKFQDEELPFDGVVEGSADLAGPLARPSLLAGEVRLTRLEFFPRPVTFAGVRAGSTLASTAIPEAADSPGKRTDSALDQLAIRNPEPIVIELKSGEAIIRKCRLSAKDTKLEATGRLGMERPFPLNLKVDGDLNLALLQTFDGNIESTGRSNINATVKGTIFDPLLNGTVSITDASLYTGDLSNGLDHANGVIRFDNKRATIQRFSARSGGGRVEATGMMTFGGSVPAVFRLNANAHNVRVRYNGVSVTFDSDLKYTGTLQSSMLAGEVTVTKAAFNPSTDVGNLFASYSSPPAVASPHNGYLHSVQLAIAIRSSPSLQLTTSLSQDVQAEIDLHLRGTPDKPALIGRCSVNEGQIQFFGNRYNINRGDVSFFNPLKIEPVLDLDLQTQASGVVINITISGTIEKLNVSYRSDPPLQPNDIVALLATGKTPNVATSYAGNQLGRNAVLAVGANTILGSAISPVSSRLQRFFGVTHIKIDPMVQGIEDVPQARLTLEQQISPQVSITYVTNLSRTAEQIFRLEWALNREYSIIAIRDENGLFGVDIQYKKRFK
jgi:translocation and assembly module TamB